MCFGVFQNAAIQALYQVADTYKTNTCQRVVRKSTQDRLDLNGWTLLLPLLINMD